MSAPTATKSGPDAPPRRRTAARLVAVQAIFQGMVSDTPVSEILAEFVEHRLEQDSDTGGALDIDREHFIALVRGTDREREQLDTMIEAVMAEGWSMARLDRVLHAILRAGVYELLSMPDVPPRVTINEYVEVARDFFDGKEPGFVNGALDRMAHTLRPEEMAATP